MRPWFGLLLAVLLIGCQTSAPRPVAAPLDTADALQRLRTLLPGDYDNHEQVLQAARGEGGGRAIAVPHRRETWRLLSADPHATLWLVRLIEPDRTDAPSAVWLYLISAPAEGTHLTLTPYRALDEAAANAAMTEPRFTFVPAQWAELAPCAQKGVWQDSEFRSTADRAACAALVPGLGAAAALLPLSLRLDGERLETVTFADQARGADASTMARRVRWFVGWSAINGGGPLARASNRDWHTRDDLRLGSEGGRVALRWRDGAPSGYSLELERRTYPERKLVVLQLDVIEDASGQVIAYVWSSADARAIGLNLGWLQVGLTSAPAP
jgi:hypothetical protein